MRGKIQGVAPGAKLILDPCKALRRPRESGDPAATSKASAHRRGSATAGLWRSISSSFHARRHFFSRFSQDGGLHGVMELSKDQPMDATILNKAGHRVRPVLPDAERQIAGHADIKSPIALAREDVNAWSPLDHLRSRGPGSPLPRGRRISSAPWLECRASARDGRGYFSCMIQTPSHRSSGGLAW
jgi:hypothetical protein